MVLENIKKNLFKYFGLFLSINLLYINSPTTASNIVNEKSNSSDVYLDKEKLDKDLNGQEYILGEGDSIFIDFEGLSFFSRTYIINPEGNMILPEIGDYLATGKTLIEIKNELTNLNKNFISDPQIKLSIFEYRPVNIYIMGEVKNPGLYKLTFKKEIVSGLTNKTSDDLTEAAVSNNTSSKVYIAPRLFDALVLSKGFTNEADLSDIKIIRNNTASQGGGKISAKVNFLSLLIEGDQTKNIRVFDGDTIIVPKSDSVIKDQILEIQRSNLSPEIISVFITGNVRKRGEVKLKKGSSLNHAIASTGGKKILTGNVEFIRFKYDGKTEKSYFGYDPNASIDSRKNPILMDGDIINVKRTPLGVASEVLGEISNPVVTGYGLYKIFN